MFTRRTVPFRKTKVITFLNVFLACVSLSLAAFDDRSVTHTGHAGPARRSPKLSFKVPEGSHHHGKLAESQDVYHRRSLHNEMKKDDNHVSQWKSASSRRRVNHRRTDVHANININQNHNGNHNPNMNINSGGASEKNSPGQDESIEVDEIVVEDDFDIGKLEAKLYSWVKFRSNIISVFGQILKAPKNRLTADQYSALKLILEALLHKQVDIFNMLPLLEKLRKADKETQFKIVIRTLTNNVPAYMACVAKFLGKQIDKNLLDIGGIIDSLDHPASFLEGLESELIDTSRVKTVAKEMEPYNGASEVTLGPVFVKIFNALNNNEITLTPKLFGAILANLPVGKFNPVLEEYVDYVWHMMQINLPPNWDEVTSDIKYGTPYEVVKTVIKKLLDRGNISSDLQRVLKYIVMHLKEVPNTFADEYYQDMGMLLNEGGNFELMISMIPDDEDIPELGDFKGRIISYIRQKKVYADLKSMNKYSYEKPIHMVMALLARIQSRAEDEDIKEAATKLLCILNSHEDVGSIRLTVSADVDLPMLLEFLNVPDGDRDISALGKEIQKYLDGHLDVLMKLQELLLKEDKSNCQRPVQCLLQLFTKTVDSEPIPGLGMPSELIKMIRHLLGLMKGEINGSEQCESHDVMCVEHPDGLDGTIGDPYPVQPAPPPAPSSMDSPVAPVHTTYDSDESSSYIDNMPLSTYTDDNEDSSSPTTSDEYLVLPGIWDESEESPDTKETSIPVQQPQPKRESRPQPKPRPKVQSKPHVTPKPKPVRQPTVKPMVVPQHIQSVETPPSTRPPPTKKPPAEYEPDNSSPQADNEPILPPYLSYDRPMYVVFPKDDGPPYMSSTKLNGFDSVIEYSSIEKLLMAFDTNTPFSIDELPDIPEIFGPIKTIVGPHFVEKLLGKPVDKNNYPTTISLVEDLLNHALHNPKVAANPALVELIQLYLKGIDYITISALFPVVIDSQKIPSDVLYVTFDPDNPNTNSVDSEPPRGSPSGFMTLAIYHPKFWVQQVDPDNPYGTLLPSQSDGNPIQELINDGSLLEVLGPNFNPFLYPNRGTLLTSILQKLTASKRVKSNPQLMKMLSCYWKSIRTVAMYNKLPSYHVTHLLEMQHSNEVNWQPDTATLIMALPAPRNHLELKKFNLIKAFLERPNLLELLGIRNLPFSITRGELLKMIFYEAIWGKKMVLDLHTMAALKYYEAKILIKGFGALPIVWVWVQMFIIREEVPLGEVIETVIDYDKLSRSLQVSYNELMTYFSGNPHLLQDNDDFPFEKYPTKGSFLRGLFNHFLKKPGVSPMAKKYIRQLLPHINLKGRGLESMNHVTIDDITKSDIVKSGFSALMKG